jgi:holliday junction DNA helicase RuvA
MIDHLEGRLSSITPTYAVVDCGGVGYLVHISLYTFSKIKDLERVRILTHLVIREDAHVLYGFGDEHEREIFRHLISVSGVGAATARVILSSMPPKDIELAIIAEDVISLKKVKGIGAKTAERIIVDLKGRLGKGLDLSTPGLKPAGGKFEAAMALVALGFNRAAAEKALEKAAAQGSEMKVEDWIKVALKHL